MPLRSAGAASRGMTWELWRYPVQMEDPRDHALRKFDAGTEPPLWTALDVVVRYATDPPVAIATLLNAVRPAVTPGSRICELGFGPGWFLEELTREFPSARLVGLDLSRSAVADAARAFGGTAAVMLGDMERLPFASNSFSVLTTNWTLYFVRDIAAALAEMRRCIAPGGRFVAATVAPDHMLEFDEMVAEAVRRALGRERAPDLSERFNTQTGLPYVERAFDDVALEEYGGEMVLPNAETVMALWDGYGPQLPDDDEDAAARAEFERLVRERLNRDGLLYIRRHDGVFVGVS